MSTQIPLNYAAAMGIGFNLVQHIIAAAADGVISAEEVLQIVKDGVDAYSAATGHPLQIGLSATSPAAVLAD